MKVTPRGGIEWDHWEISQIYRRKLKKLIKASQDVLDEVDAIHDNDQSPQKYRAPYGSLAELRKVLSDIDNWPSKAKPIAKDVTNR